MLLLLTASCLDHTGRPAEYDPTVPIQSETDGVEVVSSTVPCPQEEIAPYDPARVITYTLDVNEQTLNALDAQSYGWSYGETYTQIQSYGESVTIDVPGCDSIVYDDPRVGMGRQMGWLSPYAEGSWVVEYNERHDDQVLGGYDDARYWAPTYDGPVNVVWLYEYAMEYVGIPHRLAVWMRFRTTWWGDQEAVYNALEPYEDDFADRVGAYALWEGYDLGTYPGEGAVCKAGDCTAAGARADACMERLNALGDLDALIPETGDCFDWTELAAVAAFQDWFAHWDGCGQNNCYGMMVGESADDPATWKMQQVVSGVDLLLGETWTPVENVDFLWYGGTAATYCRADASVGGCRDQYVAHLRALSELSTSGKMETDLREVYALRQSLDIALDGDDVWVDASVDWITERPAYVETAIESMLYPCGRPDTGDTAATPPPGGGFETGVWRDPCGPTTDTAPLDSGVFVETGF